MMERNASTYVDAASYNRRQGGNRKSVRLATVLLVTLLWTLILGSTTVHAAPVSVERAQEAAPEASLSDSPRDCIDPLMAGHIVATLASLAPVPGFADAADAAAYALNIALKHCPPDLTPPPPIVVEKPSEGCAHRLEIPAPVKFADLVAMDKAIIREILDDPDLNLTLTDRGELETELNSEYGRFDTIAYGNYTDVYGISLPIRLDKFSVPYWGDIGAPSVFHYNSDALIEMTIPGKRVSPDEVEVPVGNLQVQWKADTLITIFDKIPLFLASSAMRYYKAAQAKAQKRLAIDASNEALQIQIQLMLKEGNVYFAKQIAKEVAENALKKGAVATKKIVSRSSRYQTSGDFTGATTLAFQPLTVVDTNSPSISGVQPIVVEAFDPGGIQSGRKIQELMAAIQVTE